MKRHSLENILKCTLRCCNVSREEWLELMARRIGYVVRVKQLFSFIAFNEGYLCKEIAPFIGQHRTTVIHHINTTRDEVMIYPAIKDQVDKITQMLDLPPKDHQKRMVTSGWLARSSTGLLTISPHIPERMGGYWVAEGSKPFPSDQSPQVTYETGPFKVKINITIEDYEEM